MADVEIRLVVKDDGSVVLRQFGSQAEQSLGKVKDSTLEIQQATQQLARTGGVALAGISASLTAAGVSAINTARNFDAGLREVNTLLGFSEQGFQDLKSQVEALDPSLGRTEDLVAGLYQTISAGITEPQQAMAFLEQAAIGARAGLAQLDTAVLAGTKTLEGFGLEADQSQRVFDVLFQTVKQGQTNFQDLATVAGDVASTAGVMNVSLEENFATLAQLTKTAGSTAQAATQLDGIFRAMIKPTEAMQEAIKEIGFETGSAAIETLGWEETLRQLVGTTDGTETSLGKLFSRAEGLRGVIALSKNDFEGLNQQLAGMATAGDGAGAAMTAFEEQQKAVNVQLENLGASIQRVAIGLGDAFLPAISATAEGASGLAQTFAGLPDSVQQTVSVLGGITAAVTGLGGAFLLMLPRIQATQAAMATLAAQGGTTAKAMQLLGLTMKGVAVAGAFAAGAAIGTLINKFVIGEQALADFLEGTQSWARVIDNTIPGVAMLRNIVGEIPPAIDRADASMQGLAGSMENVRTNLDFINRVSDVFRENTGRVNQTIREGIASGRDYDDIISSIAADMQAGGADAEVLRAAVQQVTEEMNRAATENKFADLLDRFGIETVPQAVDQINELTSAFDANVAPQSELQSAAEQLVERFGAMGQEIPEVAEALAALRDRMQESAEQGDGLADVLERLGITTRDDVNQSMTDLERAVAAGSITIEQSNALLESWAQSWETAGLMTEDLRRRIDDLTFSMPSNTEALARSADELNRLAIEAARTAGSVPDVKTEMDLAIPTLDQSRESFQRHTDATFDAGQALTGFFDVIRTGKQWLDNLIGSVVKFVGTLLGGGGLGDALSSAAGGLGGLLGGLVGGGGSGLGGILGNIGGALLGGGGGGPGNILGGLLGGGGGGAGGLGGIIAGLFGGGGGQLIGGAGAANLGGSLGAGILGSGGGVAGGGGILGALGGAGSSIASALGSAASAAGGALASVGSSIASFVSSGLLGATTLGVGAVVPLLFALLGGPSTMEKGADEIGKTLGDRIGGSLNEHLTRSIGKTDILGRESSDRFANLRFQLGAIVNEAGILPEELDRVITTARETFAALDMGNLDARESAEALSMSLPPIVREMEEIGASQDQVAGLGDIFRDMLNRVREGSFGAADAARVLDASFPQLEQSIGSFGAEGDRLLKNIIAAMDELGISGVDKFRQLADAAGVSYQQQAQAAEQATTQQQSALEQAVNAQKAAYQDLVAARKTGDDQMIESAQAAFAAATQAAEDARSKMVSEISTAGIQVGNHFFDMRQRGLETFGGIIDDARRAGDEIGGAFDQDFRIGIDFDVGEFPEIPGGGNGNGGASFQTRPGQFRRVPGSPHQAIPGILHGGEIVFRPRETTPLGTQINGFGTAPGSNIIVAPGAVQLTFTGTPERGVVRRETEQALESVLSRKARRKGIRRQG